MLGVPLDGPTDTMCDKQGVVKNTSLSHLTLGKKHNAVNYHVLREAAEKQIWQIF